MIEVMVVIAIVSVVTALAAPTMLSVIRDNRLDAAVAELRAALLLGRSEAVKRSSVVVVEPTSPGDWTGGFRVYAGAAMDLTRAFSSANDTVLRENAMRSTGLSVMNGPARVGFDAKGASVSLGAKLAEQAPEGKVIKLCAATQGRELEIKNSGLVVVRNASC